MTNYPEKSTPSTPAASMSRGRMVLATVVVGFIVAGQLYDTIRKRENWPFSNYPMFSRLSERRDFSRLVVRGVGGRHVQIDLGDPQLCAPLPPFHLRIALDQASRSKIDPVAAMQAVVQDYLRLYEARRKAGLHDGPPLTGMRVYLLQWNDVDSWAKNARSPDRDVLLFDSLRPRRPVNVTAENPENKS